MRADRWRHRLTTIRVRQTLLAVLIVGLGLVVGGLGILAVVRHALIDSAHHRALQRARDTAALLRLGPLPAVLPPAGEDEPVVQVVNDQGQVVSASAELRGRPPVVSGWRGAQPTTATIRLPIGEGADYRVVGIRADDGHRPLAVYAASSLEPARDAVSATGFALAVAVPLFLACVAATSWSLVGRSLRPVEEIRRQVDKITASELDRRVPEPAVQDELGHLARTMNTMLDRLQRAHARQRRFVSDASHELRSPLAAIRTRVEVGLAHPEETDWVALAHDVHREGSRLDRLVDELLALSSAHEDRSPVADELVDLDELVLAEVDAIRTRGKVTVDLTALSPVRLSGRPEQLRLVVRNLLDNAERHASTEVVISMSAEDSSAELVISDDGDGIPAADRERVFDPFFRLQPARDRASGGAGLGLAIVRDAVAAHGGAIWFADAPTGAQVHVRLPIS